jgi:alkanesulfonate monooxygenase SsuD/methylene tetrahydromethanopterin reductase-like flavin-dependent oxidoreductase (luciferase family)
MRFGLLCTTQTDRDDLDEYLEFNVEAEALGFDSSFLVEHHFSGWNQVSSPLMLLTCVAMRTQTLRLGTGVLVLPWHNPLLLAEQVATLDVISGGRVDLGIGKGYRHTEFRGFRMTPEEAAARFEEALEVMMCGWTTRARFSHTGRYWQFDDVVVEPEPVQTPHPPLWVAAAREASIERAAAQNFNLMLDQYASPDQVATRLAAFRARSDAPVAVARQVYVARDRADADNARAGLAEYTQRTVDVSRAPGRDGGSHVLAYAGATEDHALFGTADECCDQLAALQDRGVDNVLCTFFRGADQLRRFARDVMPAFLA